ncbi:Transcription termination factor like [Quillaja saponaria]|uniref:Transcription termination factor like n=2 Tax=Quillaja saponaria TaxID=32244 RepID=A0AAD7LQ14_QUISA|nr:Transcription termination factor like [Quillaja saponaria]
MHSSKSILILSSNSKRYLLSLFSTISSPTQPSNRITLGIDDLLSSIKLNKNQSIYISNRISRLKSLEKPQSVINFLQKTGLSESHVKSAVRGNLQMLFADVEKNLKPKIEYFQQLGIVGSDMGKFLSWSSHVLRFSLEKTLIPNIEFLKKVLCNDKNNNYLIKALIRCGSLIRKFSDSRLARNAAFLESCGIVGSQLSVLMIRQPSLFVMKESIVRDSVSRAVDMGFSLKSKMFVYAMDSTLSLTNETIRRKLELVQSCGISKEESMEMFRISPILLQVSEGKLKFGIEFYLHTVKWPKSVLIRRPSCLMFSMEDRVVPRYKVFQMIMSKRLLGNKVKKLSFSSMLIMTEQRFLKFISRFGEDAEELLVAYRGHDLLVSSKQEFYLPH